MMRTRLHLHSEVRHGSRGYTLIELLIASSLGAVVLLVSVVVFREAADAMSVLNRQGKENDLLRAGYFAVTEDADYWHSHANPSYPYLRGHASERLPNTDPRAGGVFDTRPFVPVEWPSDLRNPRNPNWRQPYDARSWYRTGLMPNVQTGTYRLSVYNTASGTREQVAFDPMFRFAEGEFYDQWKNINTTADHPLGVPVPKYNFFDTQGIAEYDGISVGSSDAYTLNMDLPPGWDFWKVMGDLAALSNIDGWSVDADNDEALDSDAERSPDGFTARHDHPIGFTEAFSNLGIWGVDSYLPPGTPNLVVTSSTNLKTKTVLSSVDSERRMYRRGEIPWMYQDKGSSIYNGLVSDIPTGLSPVASRSGGNTWDAADFSRTNWYAVMPDYFDLLRASWKSGPVMPIASDLSMFDADGPFTTARFVKMFGGLMGRDMMRFFHDLGAAGSNALATQVMVMPSSPLPFIDPGLDRVSRADDLRRWNEQRYVLDLSRPFQGVMPSVKSNVTGTQIVANEELRFAPVDTRESLDVSAYQSVRDRDTAWTYRVPLFHTGDPNPVFSEDPVALRLRTGIYRERFNGIDRAECAVEISDVSGDVAYRMRFNTLGSNLLGARSHWGRNSDTTGLDVYPGGGGTPMRLGDTYGP